MSDESIYDRLDTLVDVDPLALRDEAFKLARQVEQLTEALRRHVMDWGDCGSPESCDCSHAAALRLLRETPA